MAKLKAIKKLKIDKKLVWVVVMAIAILFVIAIIIFSPRSEEKTTTPAAKPTPVAATCTASNAGLDAASAIYVKGTVNSVDSSGKTQTLTDDCINTTYLEKYICYESPTGSGHYASGRTVVKCANGCVNGACKK